MKWKIILVIIVLVSGTCWLILSQKAPIADDRAAQKAAHDSFMGSPPEPSKPYNIMDYTKPQKQ